MVKNIILAIIVSTLFLGGLVWADNNGVWHEAEDVRPGTFGNDEDGIGYVFPDDVDVQGDLTVEGVIKGDSATGNVVVQLG